MRSTFWPNLIFERQSFKNRHLGLKFSSKRENSALSMKIIQKRCFQVMRSTFWPNRIFERESFQNRHAGLEFSSKTRKQCAFHANCTKRSFQVMRSTFWPNQSFENRETGLKFSSKRKNSALCKKIVQNPRFRSCAARFGQILFFCVKVLKIVKLAWNSLQSGKTVRFSWKLYNTLFSGHAQQVLAKSHFGASKFSKSSRGPEILSKTRKQCAFQENFTKPDFQVMRSTFWPNRIFERQSSQNRHLGLKILVKPGKQCAFHENCTRPSFQAMRSTFWPNRIFEPQSSQNRHLGLKFSSKRENSALSPWKLYKTLLSGHAQHVLAKSHFWSSKFSKSSRGPEILGENEKTVRLPSKSWNWRSFQVMRISSKQKNSALSKKIVQNALFRSCAARFGQIAFLSGKFLKFVKLASNSLQSG